MPKVNWHIALSLGLQVFFIIWFAAKINASVEALQHGFEKHNIIMERIIDKQSRQDIDIAVIKSKISI